MLNSLQILKLLKILKYTNVLCTYLTIILSYFNLRDLSTEITEYRVGWRQGGGMRSLQYYASDLLSPVEMQLYRQASCKFRRITKNTTFNIFFSIPSTTELMTRSKTSAFLNTRSINLCKHYYTRIP